MFKHNFPFLLIILWLLIKDILYSSSYIDTCVECCKYSNLPTTTDCLKAICLESSLSWLAGTKRPRFGEQEALKKCYLTWVSANATVRCTVLSTSSGCRGQDSGI